MALPCMYDLLKVWHTKPQDQLIFTLQDILCVSEVGGVGVCGCGCVFRCEKWHTLHPHSQSKTWCEVSS